MLEFPVGAVARAQRELCWNDWIYHPSSKGRRLGPRRVSALAVLCCAVLYSTLLYSTALHYTKSNRPFTSISNLLTFYAGIYHDQLLFG